MKKILFAVLALCFLVSCNSHKEPKIAFYYWKTVFKLSPLEREVLQENDVKKIYIRFFDIDIDKNNQPFPLAPIQFKEKMNALTVVPVVYIKNKVMLNQSLDVALLARKIFDFVNKINATNQISCQEIQIDCDWTLDSKDNYMKFIEVFKSISRKKLSATIRLHQIKYFNETKIPAVDCGVLMYYNMGKIAPDSLNSIYDCEIASKYLPSLEKYPLKLNLALPVYSWAVHIRDQKVIGLKPKIDYKSLEKDTNFTAKTNLFFVVNNSNYKGGTFYKRNDVLKIERVTTQQIKDMSVDLESHMNTRPEEIIFYDLDEINLSHYEKNIFKQAVARF